MIAGRRHIRRFMKHLRNRNDRYVRLYAAAVFLLLFSAVLGLRLGATEVGFFDALRAIFRGDTYTPEARILLYVRLPRVLACLLCGAALSVSGATIQGVLANRLASPSILGVNAGAGLAVTVASACGILGGWRLSLFAFCGAFFAVLLVSVGAKKWGLSRGSVILMGVALNALLGALSDTVTTFVPEVSVMSNDFKIGDFSAVTYARVAPAAVVILFSIAALMTLSNELDLVTLGDETAQGLGLNTGLMRIIFLILSALLAGAAVSVCGLLSFVGLLVPHAVRRMATSESGHLLPLCAICGAGFVTFCDTLSRWISAPYELPVGIVMSFLGAPFFILILVKGKGGHSRA